MEQWINVLSSTTWRGRIHEKCRKFSLRCVLRENNQPLQWFATILHRYRWVRSEPVLQNHLRENHLKLERVSSTTPTRRRTALRTDCNLNDLLHKSQQTMALTDSRCANRVVTGAALGASLGGAVGGCNGKRAEEASKLWKSTLSLHVLILLPWNRWGRTESDMFSCALRVFTHSRCSIWNLRSISLQGKKHLSYIPLDRRDLHGTKGWFLAERARFCFI